MTIALSANTPRISYTVNEGATQTSFAVPFVFFTGSTDLNVFVDNTERTFDASTSNTSLYTVSGGSGSTGTVTTSVTGATGGSTVVITRDIELKRTTDFPSSGAFEISKLNTELDTVTAIQSDFNDSASRAIRLQEFDDAVSMELPLLASRKGTVLGFNATTGAAEAGPTIANVNSLADITSNINTVGGISANVTTVAGIASDVTTVAGISSNVSTVAGISSNVTTVAGKASLITSDFASDMALIDSTFVSKMNLVTSDFVTDMAAVTSDFISDLNDLATTAIIQDLDLLATSDFISDLNQVEGIKANVTTVAGVASNVSTVAGIASNVTAVAGDASDIGTVATNISNVNTVAGVSSNVTTVAGISSNVTTVAGVASNVTTVAGDTSAINTVAGDSSNIGTVATNISTINSVAATVGGSKTYTVTVANVGGSNIFLLDGANNPAITLTRGFTYIFDQSDSSNASHPLAFKNGSSAYTTGVTVTGTAGQAGAKVTFVVPDDAPATGLRYYCTTHGNAMGNTITTITNDIATVVANLDAVNGFAARYRVASSAPTDSLDAGDLYYNTTSNSLNYYNGSSFQAIVAGAMTSLSVDSTPQLGGNLDVNGNSIVSASNGDITIAPNGSGEINLNGTVNTDNLTMDFGSIA